MTPPRRSTIAPQELPAAIYLAVLAADGIKIIRTDGTQLGYLAFGEFGTPAISPDLRFVAFTSKDSQFWFLDLEKGTVTRFQPYDEVRYSPSWAPDSRRLAVNAMNTAQTLSPHIEVIELASMTYVKVTTPALGASHPKWSPDGSWIVFSSAQFRNQQPTTGLFVLAASCVTQPPSCVEAIKGPLGSEPGIDLYLPSWAPTSDRLSALCSRSDDITEHRAICLVDFPSGEIATTIDLAGCVSSADWSPDGTMLAVTDCADHTGVITLSTKAVEWIADEPFAFWIDRREGESH